MGKIASKPEVTLNEGPVIAITHKYLLTVGTDVPISGIELIDFRYDPNRSVITGIIIETIVTNDTISLLGARNIQIDLLTDDGNKVLRLKSTVNLEGLSR